MSRTDAQGREAGLTLVEVLVVLVLIGVVTSAVGLSLGAATRGPDARQEADLLAARMRRASEEALLTSQPVALAWTDRDYRFLVLRQDGWAPHPVALLAEPKLLDGGIRFEGASAAGGSFVVTGDDLPAGGTALNLRLGVGGGDSERAVAVAWDGATASVAEAGG